MVWVSAEFYVGGDVCLDIVNLVLKIFTYSFHCLEMDGVNYSGNGGDHIRV